MLVMTELRSGTVWTTRWCWSLCCCCSIRAVPKGC